MAEISDFSDVLYTKRSSMKNSQSARTIKYSSAKNVDFFNKNRLNYQFKRNIVNCKPIFHYEDLKRGTIDYHSISPSKQIDLNAEQAPSIRNSQSFYKEYSNKLAHGFGLQRGEFTVQANQKTFCRLMAPQIKSLRSIVAQKQKIKSIHSSPKEKTQGAKSRSTPESRALFVKVSPSKSNNEIQQFEKHRNRLMLTPVDRRFLYNIEK